ncbi:DUF47 domain-containing protein [Methanogenium marinum]|uniref:DUF47 domain-containing protein n=1 Tax=Methanogenium marinum TaxID=348610 RepID=A0A9Q4KW05_9EURY|nr:DUF47 domain-containing protein [Methanogenium marinum]MDE4908850.1 DUF47 domain-containing protein [Methanogenium marinum]
MDTKKNNPEKNGKKRNLFGSVFPQEYNFEAMLVEQAEITLSGMEIFIEWIHEDSLVSPSVLISTGKEVDLVRYRLEDKLMEAFSTPFNRQDIYTLSRNIDYILNYAVDTAREMHAFDVSPDDPIREMSENLLYGTRQVVEGTRSLGTDKEKVEECIRKGRTYVHTIEDCYIACMADLFRTDDAMNAMKKREIYHHLRDGGKALRMTLYIMHKAVVGLA